MKKFELGMFALCALVGGYFGSLFGTAIAICLFMTVSGLFEEIIKNRQKMRLRREEKLNA